MALTQEERKRRIAAMGGELGILGRMARVDDTPEMTQALREQAEAESAGLLRQRLRRMRVGTQMGPMHDPAQFRRQAGTETWYEEMPGHQYKLATDYAPADKKRIEQLYKDRSEVVISPDYEEQERQDMLDAIDAEIRSVPHMPPVMRPPSPAETFQQKSFKTAEGVPMIQKENGDYDIDPVFAKKQDILGTQYPTLFERNLKYINEQAEEGNAGFDLPDMQDRIDRARTMTDSQIAPLLEAYTAKQEDQIDPQMQSLWMRTIRELDLMRKPGLKSKIKEADMMTAAKEYAQMAQQQGVPYEHALGMFFLQWREALVKGDNLYSNYLPAMGPEAQAAMRDALVASGTQDPGGNLMPEAGNMAGGPEGGANLPQPKTKAEYDALPKGQRYIAPDGTERTKG